VTKRARPTISEVAQAAGVSKGAVSLALNNRAGVADETRTRILEVSRSLGWTPNHRARALSTSRAYAVGLVIARPPETLGADPFFPAFIAGVERILTDRGRALVLQVVPNQRAETASYRRLAADGRVDGLFLLDLRIADRRIRLLKSLRLPVVTVGRPDVASPFPAVLVDDRQAIAETVTHLVELGHEHIAYVAGPNDFLHGATRRAAWEAALAANALPPGPCLVSDFSASDGASATRTLLNTDDPPTAIVYANDVMAIAGLTVARECGVDVPGELSITGFDDTELAAHVSPGLTSVRSDPFGWGRAAARTLLDLIDGKRAADVEMPPARLVIRASTAPAHRRRAHPNG
jgi:DNA-binding LacI/PurR family transcriptional regulator